MSDDLSRLEFDKHIALMSDGQYEDYKRRLTESAECTYRLDGGPKTPHLLDAEVQNMRWLPKDFVKRVYEKRSDMPQYWIVPSPETKRKHYQRMIEIAKLRL